MSNTTYCRLCAELKPDSDVVVVTKDSVSPTFNLNTKISQCFQIQIEPGDNLPNTVCSTCCDIANHTFELHQRIQQAQEFLKSVYHLLVGAPVEDDGKDFKVEWKKDEPVDIKEESRETDRGILDDDFPTFQDTAFDDDDDWSDSNDVPLSQCIDVKKEIKTEDSEEKPKRRRKKVEIESDGDGEEKSETQKKREEEWKDYVWTCSACSKDFKNMKSLRKHYKLDHNNKQPEYTCMDCAKVYQKYPLFRRHVQKHRDKFKYRCDICNKFFHLKFRYQTHMKHVHETSDQQYICAECGKSFKWPSSLDNHRRYVHVTDDKKYQFECDICHKKVLTASNLAMHKKVHEVEKNFICEQCGRNFKEKGTLVQHMSTHLEVCSFACEECPKAFKDLYGLRRHKKVHMDSELYHCEVCARPFKHKRALKRHASIHTNMLPYECEYCKKCFREKSYLKIHLRQHTGEKPYSCIECNQHFTNDSNFIKHIRGRHGLERFSIANQNQYPFVVK